MNDGLRRGEIMASGEKRECGWDELFYTIWETAVRNDYEEAVKRLTEREQAV
jgi:hypothetical protein